MKKVIQEAWCVFEHRFLTVSRVIALSGALSVCSTETLSYLIGFPELVSVCLEIWFLLAAFNEMGNLTILLSHSLALISRSV